MAFCMKCGAQMADDSKFCMQCGAPREEQPVMEAVVETPTVEPVTEPMNEVSEAEPVVETPMMESDVDVPDVTPEVEATVMDTPVVTPIEEEMVQPVFQAEIPAQPAFQQEIPTGQGFQYTAPAQPTYQAEIPVQPVFNAIPQEPRKKSKGPIIAILSAAVLAIVAIVVAIVLMLQPNVVEIDLSKYITVEYEGYDTTGTAEVYLNDSKLLVDILKAQGEDATSTSSVSFSMKAFINSIELETVYFENLSNGEKITITVKYDELLMEENEIEFKNASKEYTVENLVELIEVDPFADVTVEFSGTSPNGYAYMSNNSDIDVVDWAMMDFDKNDGLKNGDVITLTIDPDDVDYAVTKGYKFTVTSKEYTVEGLKHYYTSLDEITDEHMENLKALAEKEFETENGWLYGATMSNLQYVGAYFAKSDLDTYYNEIILVYTATLTSNEDEFPETQVFLPFTIDSLLVEKGELNKYAYADMKGYLYLQDSYSSFRGYISGDVMYTEYIMDLIDDGYEITASEGMPEFKETTDENIIPALVQEPTVDEGGEEESSSSSIGGLFGAN